MGARDQHTLPVHMTVSSSFASTRFQAAVVRAINTLCMPVISSFIRTQESFQPTGCRLPCLFRVVEDKAVQVAYESYDQVVLGTPNQMLILGGNRVSTQRTCRNSGRRVELLAPLREATRSEAVATRNPHSLPREVVLRSVATYAAVHRGW